MNIYVCGAKGVGKSTIVSRLVQGSFVEGLEAGNATQKHRKEWESNGQRFWVEFTDVDEVDATYLRDADVTVVVFSVADRASFEAAKELQNRAGAGYNRVLLLGNKTDVSSREVTQEEAQALATEAGSGGPEGLGCVCGTRCTPVAIHSIPSHQDAISLQHGPLPSHVSARNKKQTKQPGLRLSQCQLMWCSKWRRRATWLQRI